MTARILTQARLKELLHYDAETGIFTWIKPSCNRVKAGGIAGYKCKTHGYIFIGVDNVNYRAHRLAWLYMTGEWPENQIDHVNHLRSDNRWNKLRSVSHQENSKNAPIRSTNKSGVTGVHFHKPLKKWVAYITVSGTRIHLGLFNCITAAAISRKAAEIKYNFHENHGATL